MSDKEQLPTMPHFESEDAEATWWASSEGRAFVKSQAADHSLAPNTGSPLVPSLAK